MTARASRRIEIEGELTILTAAEQNERLQAALEHGGGLDIGLSGVTDMDTAGLQVLMLALREASRINVTVGLRDASRAVADVLAVAHLNEALEPRVPGLAVLGSPAADGGGRIAAEPEA